MQSTTGNTQNIGQGVPPSVISRIKYPMSIAIQVQYYLEILKKNLACCDHLITQQQKGQGRFHNFPLKRIPSHI